MKLHKVLVVDDDIEIAKIISVYLKQEGILTDLAHDGVMAINKINNESYDLVLMDIMMPKMDGINAVMKLREEHKLPIIFLSAKSEDTDKILGLTIGADDYITKPFNPLELIARVKSQLRRYKTLGSQEGSNSILTNDGLQMDLEAKSVTIDGEDVKLTPLEFKILQLLMKNLGRVFSIDEIYERVWNEDNFGSDNTVAVHIRRIREKIEINPKEPKYLKVVWGIGYKVEKY